MVATAGAEAAWSSVADGDLGAPLAARAAQVDCDRIDELADRCGARFLVPDDDEWPSGLEDLGHGQAVQRRGGPPIGVWVRGPGHLAAMTERSVAIVGSRAATSYGAGVAADLASELAEDGVTVISGGAYGVDAAAHRGALAVRGPTIAVLACGVDVPYPRSNARLFDWIARDHLLVSELPPAATPTKMRFLARNRMIAALGRGTVVVEAAIRSGARNTAAWAQECGRPLMAVPGPVHSALSVAPHEMIRDGQALLVTRAAEVLEAIAPIGEHLLATRRGAERSTDQLGPQRLAVFEAVPARRPARVDDIALTAGVTVPLCLAELAALESAGLVRSSADGWRIS
nr:DNA-processing protein DprA [Microlunatus panaciterrae]